MLDAATIQFCIDLGLWIGAVPAFVCLLVGIFWRVVHIMS